MEQVQGQEVKGQETAPVSAAPKQKWHEVEGAFPYKAGDRIEIVGGEILIGRKAEVVKPSAKKDALKCILINDRTGQLQKCTITMDFAKIQPFTGEIVAKATEPAPEAEVKEEAVV